MCERNSVCVAPRTLVEEIYPDQGADSLLVDFPHANFFVVFRFHQAFLLVYRPARTQAVVVDAMHRVLAQLFPDAFLSLQDLRDGN